MSEKKSTDAVALDAGFYGNLVLGFLEALNDTVTILACSETEHDVDRNMAAVKALVRAIRRESISTWDDAEAYLMKWNRYHSSRTRDEPMSEAVLCVVSDVIYPYAELLKSIPQLEKVLVAKRRRQMEEKAWVDAQFDE